MHDGAVIHDEQTAIGDVAPTAKRIMFTVPAKNDEDDLAGVSVLMKNVEGEYKQAEKPPRGPKPKKKAVKPKARRTRGGKK
jgi:hypothetical protein